jgi:putative Mg2+ transporter-C (MgtC) family protein
MPDEWEPIFKAVPDAQHAIRVLARLAAAAVVGGVIGMERLRDGKEAGLRTHMLVALGSALFVAVPHEAGWTGADISRVIQGLATGIGFLGAGCILKLTETRHVEGLTTAASVWVTAALGIAIGSGWLWPGLLGTVLTWIVLYGLQGLEHRLRTLYGSRAEQPERAEQKPDTGPG